MPSNADKVQHVHIWIHYACINKDEQLTNGCGWVRPDHPQVCSHNGWQQQQAGTHLPKDPLAPKKIDQGAASPNTDWVINICGLEMHAYKHIYAHC